MINILHVIDTTGPGGAETVFLQLIKHLNDTVYAHTVVIRGKGYVYEQLKEIGITPYIVDAKGSFNVKYLFALVKIIFKCRIHLIQSHLLGSNVYCSVAGKLTGRPVIATLHGLVDFDNESYQRAKFGLINFGAKKIVFVSNHLKKLTEAVYKFKKKKTTTIYNGIDLTQYHFSKFSSTSIPVIIGCVGNVRQPKGYDVLIRAVALLADIDLNVIVVGDNKNKLYSSLQILMSDLGVSDKLQFVGFSHDVDNLLKKFDIFVLPSTSEGFSISTIEAMASGIPVIATKSGGPEEIISQGVDGELVNVRSPESLADGIRKLISHPEICEKYVDAAKITVEKKFSISVVVNQYEKLYQSLLR